VLCSFIRLFQNSIKNDNLVKVGRSERIGLRGVGNIALLGEFLGEARERGGETIVAG
jgi:hypothetical protein